MDQRSDLFASRVDIGGTVLDPAGIPVANSALPEIHPAVAGGGGQAALVGAYFRDDPGFSSYRIAVRIQNGPWQDRGGSLAGLFGSPVLSGAGPLTDDSAFSLHLTGARPNTLAPLVLGFSELALPFRGGTLVPFPDFLLFGFGTDSSGSLTLEGLWPAGASGSSAWFQHWILDSTGPRGLTASNGLQGSSP
jgi:hypothetical protein